jgi:hypothetical protein
MGAHLNHNISPSIHPELRQIQISFDFMVDIIYFEIEGLGSAKFAEEANQ